MKYLLRLQLRHFWASGFDRCFLTFSLYVPEVVCAVKHFTELAGLCNNLDGNLVKVRAQYLHGSGGKEWNNRRFIFPYRCYGSMDFKTFNFHEYSLLVIFVLCQNKSSAIFLRVHAIFWTAVDHHWSHVKSHDYWVCALFIWRHSASLVFFPRGQNVFNTFSEEFL